MDYKICAEINDHYFYRLGSLSMITPIFFNNTSDAGKLVDEVKVLVHSGYYEAAVLKCDTALENLPNDTHIGFNFWKNWVLWNAGQINNSEFIRYFDDLEKILPKEGFININKGKLFIREKKFNEAVSEFKKAFKKDENLLDSTHLLFWIYYLSGDRVWESALKILRDKGVKQDPLLDLVDIAESVKEESFLDSTEWPSSDDQIEKTNDDNLALLPEINFVKNPFCENIIFVSCDGGYFRSFLPSFLFSILEHVKNGKKYGIHVHIYDAFGDDIEVLENYDKQYPQLRLSYSYEKRSLAYNTASNQYYASMRFPRAYQILTGGFGVQKIVITDVDAQVRVNLFENSHINDNEVLLINETNAPLWDLYPAGFTSFSNTESGIKALGFVANFILNNFVMHKDFWFMDQIALYMLVNRRIVGEKLTVIPLGEIFGEKMKHTNEALIWTYVNDDKDADNPMNRRKEDLLKKHQIDPGWNKLVRGKYGLQIANINDEYIGRSIIHGGSWCDHEVSLIRQMVEIGNTVIEVGSNFGAHTIAIAKHVGSKGRVIAIEPQRLAFQALCGSIALNNLSNIYAYNVACGDKEGEMNVQELDPNQFQNFGAFRPKKLKGDYKIDVKTIDSLKVKECHFMKLDVEEMELDVLKGAKKTLKDHKPIIFFECHGDEKYQISKFLDDFGYGVYDFGIPNDPMFLAVTEENIGYVRQFNLGENKVYHSL